MPDISQEAVQAAALAIGREYASLREWDREAFARAALEAATPVLAAQARAQARQEVAEEIAAEIDAAGEKDEEFHYRAGMSRAAYIARQIGEARDDS
ncbi:hypothetical protein [Nonomuraea sp. NPDC003804]|uniref:hypothetical protein n=1 Tax=Nonomuraea sp. NPDC003804 TaxID=3154547 RepID=UPI0033B92495